MSSARYLAYLRGVRARVAEENPASQLAGMMVISLVISISFLWALNMHDNQKITVESMEVNEQLAQWNGRNTNWAFLVGSYLFIYIWVVSFQKFRPRHPQGKVVQT